MQNLSYLHDKIKKMAIQFPPLAKFSLLITISTLTELSARSIKQEKATDGLVTPLLCYLLYVEISLSELRVLS